MHRGYVKLWRRIQDSPIWRMPPLYLKVWCYLLCRVNWKDKLLPTQQVPKMGTWIAAGTVWTSLRDLANDVSYEDNNRTIVPDAHTISRILKWLEEYGMITMDLSRNGTLIFITNWATYQGKDDDLSQSDTHQDTHAEPHRITLTKEVKEGKEETTLPGIPAPAPRKKVKKEKFSLGDTLSLSTSEVQSLQKRLGADYDSFVKFWDVTLSVKDYGYESHYHAALKWGIEAFMKDKEKRSRNASGPTYGQGGNYV